MTIEFRLDREGGFTVADLETGLTCRAHPTSRNANQADQPGTLAPAWVASYMIGEEARRREGGKVWTRDFDTENRSRLEAGREDGSTVTQRRDPDHERTMADRSQAIYETQRLRESFPGYDPNAPGSDLIARRATGQEAAAGAPPTTHKEAAAQLAGLGYTITRTDNGDELRIAPKEGTPAEREAKAYYTNDFADAVATARHERAREAAAGDRTSEPVAVDARYDAFEVSQVVEWHSTTQTPERAAASSICEPLAASPYGTIEKAREQSDYKDDFWTVYGHIQNEGVDAIGDFPTEDAARDYLAEITGDRHADARPLADSPLTLKEYRDQADAARRAEEAAADAEPPTASILYRIDTAGEFIVGNLVTGEIGFAHPHSEIGFEAANDAEGRAHGMAAMLDDYGSIYINNHSEDRKAFSDEIAACWQTLEAGKVDGSTKEIARETQPLAARRAEEAAEEEQQDGPGRFGHSDDYQDAAGELDIADDAQDEARLAAEADHENAERYASNFKDEGLPSPVITTWEAARAVAEQHGFLLEVAAQQFDPECVAYTLTDQPGRPGFHTPLTWDVQSPQAAYDTLRYGLSLWSGTDIAAKEHQADGGLPGIGSPSLRDDGEPRRRADDTERTDPSSRVAKDMAQGIGRKLDREQRELHQAETTTPAEKSIALDANLAENIAAWDRPAMTAARALDTGRVKPTSPLLQALRDAQPADRREAADKRSAERRAKADASARDDYSVSG